MHRYVSCEAIHFVLTLLITTQAGSPQALELPFVTKKDPEHLNIEVIGSPQVLSSSQNEVSPSGSPPQGRPPAINWATLPEPHQNAREVQEKGIMKPTHTPSSKQGGPTSALHSYRNCFLADPCFFVSRYIGQVTPKVHCFYRQE